MACQHRAVARCSRTAHAWRLASAPGADATLLAMWKLLIIHHMRLPSLRATFEIMLLV